MRPKRRRPDRSFPRLEPLEPRTVPTTLVALIDTGIDLSSITDAPYYNLSSGYNAFTQQTTAQGGNSVVQDNGYTPSGNLGHWHGSTVADNIVAGIQAAESQPGGSSANVQIMPIRVTNSGGYIDDSALIRGIYYAVNHGAAAINLSVAYGYNPVDTTPGDPYLGKTLQDALAYAQANNVVVVTAAGNNSYNIDTPGEPEILYPADFHTPNMIVATAVDSAGNLSPVANWGDVHVDVGAPTLGNNGETSYAAGYTSGVAGVVAALDPNMSATQIVTYLEQSAWPSPALQGLTTTGAVINPTNAIHGIAEPYAPLAIDAGGPAAGNYVADTNVSGGGVYSTTATIDTSNVSNPAPQSVYQTSRYGAFTYTFPNLNSATTYQLSLQFAETFYTGPGQRLFNVLINGSVVLNNFDIYATAGGMNKAVEEHFSATPNASGQIVVQFFGNSALAGIELTPFPATPAGLVASAQSTSQITLSWNADPAATSYVIDRSPNGTSDWTPIGSSTTNAFTDTGLASSTTFYYEVQAVDSAGASPFSTTSSATTYPVLPIPVASSLGQDGATLASLSPLPGGNGYQDVHIILSNLDSSLPIARVVVNRLGGGALYLSNGAPGTWTSVVVQGGSSGNYATTANLYFEPDRTDVNYPYQFDVYYQGINTPVTTFANVTATANLPAPSNPTAVSLGQDGHDVASLSNIPSSTGYQDVQVLLGNLTPNLAISRVVVDRLGGGGLYLSTGVPGTWSTVVVRSGATGNYANTANLFFEPDRTDVNYPYQINVYYQGLSEPFTTFVSVTATANLPDAKTPVATSLGQDGSDFAGLSATPGADGFQDVHIRLTGLDPTMAIARVAVMRDGGTIQYLSTGAPGTWTAVTSRAQTGPNTYSTFADVYFQPAIDETNQLYWIDIYYTGQTSPVVVPVVLSDVAKLPDV